MEHSDVARTVAAKDKQQSAIRHAAAGRVVVAAKSELELASLEIWKQGDLAHYLLPENCS